MTELTTGQSRTQNQRILRASVERWARAAAADEPTLLRAGVALKDALHGHVDVVILVSATDVPHSERSHVWDLNAIPVATQALVYTLEEWQELVVGDTWLARRMRQDITWVYQRSD